MNVLELAAAAFLLFGAAFYLAGTVGLLRFPDALSRLHALTKADNVGLLLVCVGLALVSGSVREAALLLLVWLLALLAATVSAHLIARRALADEAGGGRAVRRALADEAGGGRAVRRSLADEAGGGRAVRRALADEAAGAPGAEGPS